MKTGFNLLLWTTHVTEAHFPLLEKLRAAGYDGVEIPVFEGDPAHFERVGRAIRDQGLGCTTATILPDRAHSAISPDPRSRAGALDHLGWAIECSAALSSEVLCGPFHQELAAFSGAGPTEDEKARAVEVHRQAADVAAAAGLVLALEPLNRFECYFLNTMADAAAHVRRVGRPNFGALYDTFHANIEEKDPVGCIAETADVIRHVHVSENDRGTPGKGHVPWRATFKALREAGYDGWLTIEAFGTALPALAAATKVWRPFFSAPEEVYEHGLRTIRENWTAAA
ncbi:MAG TPA: sugar phosphate isomerase/epimerase [Geminicoccaceae bacterium]|nr:sugar phosphate isomerase/epimerase [Geminicoccaceae bacterium]